jgi:hypothetical protein
VLALAAEGAIQGVFLSHPILVPGSPRDCLADPSRPEA